jgi:hypothetical protein
VTQTPATGAPAGAAPAADAPTEVLAPVDPTPPVGTAEPEPAPTAGAHRAAAETQVIRQDPTLGDTAVQPPADPPPAGQRPPRKRGARPARSARQRQEPDDAEGLADDIFGMGPRP